MALEHSCRYLTVYFQSKLDFEHLNQSFIPANNHHRLIEKLCSIISMLSNKKSKIQAAVNNNISSNSKTTYK